MRGKASIWIWIVKKRCIYLYLGYYHLTENMRENWAASCTLTPSTKHRQGKKHLLFHLFCINKRKISIYVLLYRNIKWIYIEWMLKKNNWMRICQESIRLILPRQVGGHFNFLLMPLSSEFRLGCHLMTNF